MAHPQFCDASWRVFQSSFSLVSLPFLGGTISSCGMEPLRNFCCKPGHVFMWQGHSEDHTWQATERFGTARYRYARSVKSNYINRVKINTVCPAAGIACDVAGLIGNLPLDLAYAVFDQVGLSKYLFLIYGAFSL